MFDKSTFKGIDVAIVGYCPRPQCLDQYEPRDTANQYFIHIPPSSVQICRHNGVEFLSIAHVYGGPVSSALVEELAYYGIKYILAYGLAGGLGSKGLKMGDFYLIESALARDGTTPHYTGDKLIPSDAFLNAKIKEQAKAAGLPEMKPVKALTGDAIYREYDEYLKFGMQNGCDIVNCDSSHLFAVSRDVGIQSTECGVLSDVAQGSGEEWESTLSGMLSADDRTAQDPMALAGRIVEFYAEVLIPELIQN